MKEIGGFLELDLYKDRNKKFKNNLLLFNSCRNALAYIIKVKNIKKMAVPYYLCDSIVNLLQKNNIDITFYHIKMDFTPENNIKLRTGEYLFVVNYYGQLTKKMQGKLKSQYKNIILDNTQAFFDKPLKNVDTLYSFRKFFGVPDGGGYLRMMQVTIIN